jgi:transposase
MIRNKNLFSLRNRAGMLLSMNSHTIVSIPILTGEVFNTLPESIQAYIRYLESRVQQLETQVHKLEARLSKDSSNSSKPPSSDGLKRKPKSLRTQSGKKTGGQQEHVGKGLAQVKNPDTIVIHTPASCTKCGSNLDDVQGSCVEQWRNLDFGHFSRVLSLWGSLWTSQREIPPFK